MMVTAALLFLLGCVTVIYPIRSFGLTRRSYGVFMIIGALALSVAAAPTVRDTGSNTASSPSSGFTSSSHCYTDASGSYRCDADANFGTLGSSSSRMVCRTDPVTNQPDCRYESSTK